MKKIEGYFFKSGFTLIEILVVIAVIGILATIVVVNVNTARAKAKIVVARMEVKQIYNAIILMHDDTGEWPGHKEPYETEPGVGGNEICADGCDFGLGDCMAGLFCNPEAPDDYQNWKGPYLPSDLSDPWGHEYFFDTDYDTDLGPGQTWAVVVGSYGPNGVGNNLYDSDDIFYEIITQ